MTMPLANIYPIRRIFFLGDSKTAGTLDDVTMPTVVLYHLRDRDRGIFLESPLRQGVSGTDTATTKTNIDTTLAARATSPAPDFVLINLGANDVPTLPLQVTWEANTAYILDAIHVKWPATPCRLTIAWRRTYDANCDTLATWLAAVVLPRATWAAIGVDERIVIKGGDDGATMTADGTHYSEAGRQAMGVAWLAVLYP